MSAATNLSISIHFILAACTPKISSNHRQDVVSRHSRAATKSAMTEPRRGNEKEEGLDAELFSCRGKSERDDVVDVM